MVNAGVDVVNVVFEHDSKVKVILLEERGVSSDVFSNLPEDAALSGLGGAGAEELGATEPQGGDAVMLITFGLDVEFEGYVVPRRGAMEWREVGGGVRSGWVSSKYSLDLGLGFGLCDDERGGEDGLEK
ncbi:hypothetical protein OIU76_023137 [Salix suchowensis]|uniref:Uncharacterized protein n=1 Tax=Salix suchowensis TaxID=1278906 RepID=A0ABQ9AIE1_9ROSI|nr:hypothetical protein OIU76_023137 [Salix suchowensis]KAJ6340285.1 hypothetical protein OIU77_008111 [Salix suchowensis]